jgi:hypothetical protein
MTPPSSRRWAWVAAAVALLGALVLTGRLLGGDDIAPAASGRTGGPATAGTQPAAPAGAVEIEGVQLLPTSAAFRASCRRAAGQLGFAVPCPELLPVPTAGEPPFRLCQEAEACRRGVLWLPLEGFAVPPGYTGVPGSLGALAILATSDPGAAEGMAAWCPDQRSISLAALGGREGVLATCPAGFQGWSSESVLLRWSRRGTYVTLGLRGPSEANRRLLVALAGRLPMVPP